MLSFASLSKNKLLVKKLYFKVLKAEKLKDDSVLRVQVKAEPSNGTYEARVVISDDGALRLGRRVNSFSICPADI